jgi:hypothetical protein
VSNKRRRKNCVKCGKEKERFRYADVNQHFIAYLKVHCIRIAVHDPFEKA